MNVTVLLNANAGSVISEDLADSLRESFLANNATATIHLVRGHQIIDTARRALANRPDGGLDALVAAGGDGTVSAAASVLAHSDIPLGVIPLGTLNHFARDLKLPLDVDQAIRTIAAGHVIAIDLAAVNDHIFINNSSIGLYPQMVRDRDSQRLRLGRGKWIAMLFAILRALRRYPLLRVRLGIGDTTILRQTPFVFVGNNSYEISLFTLRGRERLDAGQLSLYSANRPGRFGMVILALRAIIGRLNQAKDFDATCLPELYVESPKSRLHVALDGEVRVLSPPLHYRSLPGALKVFVPPPTENA